MEANGKTGGMIFNVTREILRGESEASSRTGNIKDIKSLVAFF